MKRGILTSAAILANIGFYSHLQLLAQPAAIGNYVPSVWQPQAAVNPKQPILLTLVNQTGLPLVYTPTIGTSVRGQSQLLPRKIAAINIGISPQTGDIANVLINSLKELDTLHYDFKQVGTNNVVVRIRRAEAERIERAVYIDERGRVYAF